MSTSSGRKWQFVQDLILVATAPFLVYFLTRSILSRLDPHSEETKEARLKADAAKQKLDNLLTSKRASNAELDSGYGDDDDGERLKKEDLQLTSYEQTIAMEVVAPNDIPVSFDDIGGLEDIIEELKESVIYPLTLPHLYSNHSSLLAAPSGVLLYGPPGCGKTMLAKALAHESGACFINLHISTLTEKWYGDSNKLVNAVFSLARKVQPAIVFIDEIDAVLGTRRSGEHEASGMVKAEFMTHWDGLSSTNASGTPQRIVILGATNRIQDIDEAILRRMPKKFPVSLPSAHQRRGIFSLILRGTKVDAARFDLDYLVRASAGMSGSDIKEACRDAAMAPVREYIKLRKAAGAPLRKVDPRDVRGIRTEDFFGRKGAAAQAQDGSSLPAESIDGDEEGSDNVMTTTDEEISGDEDEFVDSQKEAETGEKRETEKEKEKEREKKAAKR